MQEFYFFCWLLGFLNNCVKKIIMAFYLALTFIIKNLLFVFLDVYFGVEIKLFNDWSPTMVWNYISILASKLREIIIRISNTTINCTTTY